jgi:hypothetical protein
MSFTTKAKLHQKGKERRKPYYCPLCWQEFDYIQQHNAPSLHNGERLNGFCSGDIRSRAEFRPSEKRRAPTETPALEFSGDPIEIK